MMITLWRSKVFWLSFLITVAVSLFLASRVERIIPGATAVKLVAGCQATLLDTRLQPVFTVALDCPGVDSIRLWPLPVLQPFYEDPILPKGSQRAKTDIKLYGFTGHLISLCENRGLKSLPRGSYKDLI